MARRHWLDPLARRLLVATGQLPGETADPPPLQPPAAASLDSSHAPDSSHDQAVEQELLALKLAQDPGLRLRNASEVAHAAALGWRLDVNRASSSDWLRLPGISADQVDRLLTLQRAGVQLVGADDLQQRLQLEVATVRAWLPLLDFHWYEASARPAGPPLPDLNRASAAELAQRLPMLAADRRQRLLGERRRRPFRDLADLQNRLQLPPAVLEQLIGRVRFGPQAPRGGPDLPRPAGR